MNSEILKKQVKKQIDSEVFKILQDYDTGRVVSKIEDDGIDITYTLKFGHIKEKDFGDEIKSIFGSLKR